MICSLSAFYGWTPEQVLDLTRPQVQVYYRHLVKENFAKTAADIRSARLSQAQDGKELERYLESLDAASKYGVEDDDSSPSGEFIQSR